MLSSGKAVHTGSHEEQGHLGASIPDVIFVVSAPTVNSGPKIIYKK